MEIEKQSPEPPKANPYATQLLISKIGFTSIMFLAIALPSTTTLAPFLLTLGIIVFNESEIYEKMGEHKLVMADRIITIAFMIAMIFLIWGMDFVSGKPVTMTIAKIAMSLAGVILATITVMRFSADKKGRDPKPSP